jgi:hypothetical protein
VNKNRPLETLLGTAACEKSAVAAVRLLGLEVPGNDIGYTWPWTKLGGWSTSSWS